MPTNLSSLIQPNDFVRVDTQDTLTNKTLEDPAITVNGQAGSSKQVITTDGDGNVLFAGTDGLRLPAGTTGERPSNPAIGEIRYNTDESTIEKYDGSSWSPILGATDDLDISSLSVAGNPIVDSNRVLRNVTGVNNILRKPTNISPSNQDTNVGNLLTDIDLSSTGFGSLFGGQGGAQFQVSETSDFATTVIDRNLSGGSINSVNLNLVQKELEENTTYYWRVRYYDSNNNFSLFSDPTEFTTASTFAGVDAPTITSPSDQDVDIEEEPTITTSAFSVTGPSDTHVSTDWQIATDAGFTNVIYESLDDTSNLTSLDVPAGNLQEGQTTYYVRARHTGSTLGDSDYSNEIEFTTLDTFFDYTDPANIGTAVNGGFLAGVIDTVAGTIDSQDYYQTGERYALIVAPKDLEGIDLDMDQSSPPDELLTRWNGLDATNALVAPSGPEAFVHINNIRNSDPVPSDGGSDWYLPAIDELELIYRNLKPVTRPNETGSTTAVFPGTQNWGFNPSSDPNGNAYTSNSPSQTSVTDFQDTGSEALLGGSDNSTYWSCTWNDNISPQANWAQDFDYDLNQGRQKTNNHTNTSSVRPVRRVPL